MDVRVLVPQCLVLQLVLSSVVRSGVSRLYYAASFSYVGAVVSCHPGQGLVNSNTHIFNKQIACFWTYKYRDNY